MGRRRILHERRDHFDDMIGQGTIWVRISGDVVCPVLRSYRLEDVICTGDEHEFRPGICMLQQLRISGADLNILQPLHNQYWLSVTCQKGRWFNCQFAHEKPLHSRPEQRHQ